METRYLVRVLGQDANNGAVGDATVIMRPYFWDRRHDVAHNWLREMAQRRDERGTHTGSQAPNARLRERHRTQRRSKNMEATTSAQFKEGQKNSSTDVMPMARVKCPEESRLWTSTLDGRLKETSHGVPNPAPEEALAMTICTRLETVGWSRWTNENRSRQRAPKWELFSRLMNDGFLEVCAVSRCEKCRKATRGSRGPSVRSVNRHGSGSQERRDSGHNRNVWRARRSTGNQQQRVSARCCCKRK